MKLPPKLMLLPAVALPCLLLASTLPASCAAQAQEDPRIVLRDGGSDQVLQSIVIPPVAHAPFSLTLATEWARPLAGGGSFTVANSRPIKRDSAGRIYEERWLLAPKGSEVKSTLRYIQIGDVVSHTLYTCGVREHVCELTTWGIGAEKQTYAPSNFASGPLPDGKGTRTHEDLGTDVIAGVVVHGYRDSTTLASGSFGNDRPMTTTREVHFSAQLSLNLNSVLESPSIGRQTFLVTQLSTEEPDPAFFQPPAGYRLVDHRKPVAPADPAR